MSDRLQADSAAWSLLLDKEMTAYPGGIPIGAEHVDPGGGTEPPEAEAGDA